ncbi:MAG: hypothetical protein ACYDCK_13805 [Thermoplasmatota archaeon]
MFVSFALAFVCHATSRRASVARVMASATGLAYDARDASDGEIALRDFG